MKKNKWHLHRAGVLNFWYYDEEEFAFANGKLLLRGSNGSGKSVTMQSLIPVLLDGKKSPDRLDPFGSKARKMEDYLLGEKGVVDREERTGYLYLEYKREGLEQYLTTGMGLRAKRHSNLESWYFVLFDNRRIGRDLLLYETVFSVEDGKEQKIPLSRRQLENRVGNGGRVVKTQQEYLDLVNKHLFGFENPDAFEELVKLLIQLRSPKLSKDFKPTVIYEILTDALPPLSDEELRPLTDTIENMDQTKQQLDQLMREQRSLKRLCHQYDQYNRYVLAEKADGLQRARRDLDKLLNRRQEVQTALQQKQDQLDRLNEKMEQVKLERDVLTEEEKSLREHEAFNAEEERAAIENKISSLQKNIQQKKDSLEQKQRKERQYQENLSGLTSQVQKTERDMENLLDELELDAAEADFTSHPPLAEEFKKNYQKGYGFELWKQESRAYKNLLENILKTLGEQTRAGEKYKEAERELAEASKKLDLAKEEERKWTQLFEEEKDNLLAQFHRWVKENSEFLLSPEEIQVVSQRIMQIFEYYQGEEVKEPVQRAYEKWFGALQEQLSQQDHKITVLREEIAAKEKELHEWKKRKDPEPERHPDTAASREKLAAAQIPHVPFYAAVEFHDHIQPAQRERIEAAITHMGLLDALIVPEAYLDRVGEYDRVIKPSPHIFAYTLADFLYPTPVEGSAVRAEDIDNVLRSILIDDTGQGAAVVREDGSYQLSLLQGHAPGAKSIYIGQESRRRYRAQVIEELKSQLLQLEQELNKLIEQKEQLAERKQRLVAENRQFPSFRDARTAYDTRQDMSRQVKLRQEDVERKNDLVKKAYGKLQDIKNTLRRLTAEMNLPTTEEAYQIAWQRMQNYINLLHNLELVHKDHMNLQKNIGHLQGELHDLMADVDELKGDLNVLEGDLKKNEVKLKQVLERLQELGAEEIRARMAQVLQRLQEIPDELMQLARQIEGTRRDMEDAAKEIATIGETLSYTNRLYSAWQRVFLEDLKLGYVTEAEAETDTGEAGLMKKAKEVLQAYGHLLQDKTIDRGKVENRLNQVFYQEQGVLVEYRLTQEESLEVTDLPEVEDGSLRVRFEQLRQKSRRVVLLMEYNGKKVSVYYVLQQMDKDIDLQKMILNEKDRELYEEVILNSVGRVIKRRINRAEEWVRQIDELMKQRDTSSGLTFSIQWKPRTAEHEEEMDTRDLVELLRSDPRLLKEQDVERVTQHFRSKVNRAKEVLADKGYGESFHQIIKEMLDYRQWFSFTLYYRREGEPRKELTNNVFYTFSGGEKAMAMYIPLFSAAYSRYLEAREDAPYIISLDEAFAGVDENNIRDMFDLVEKLGFDYIMNSQALWGDYDTVSSLSICELVRPKNAPYVSVVRYYWDGRARHLLHKRESNL
ncbi:TIGR02680 family protein [Desulforamulus putei DSM 12395]|uniref:TIGR02680 family protein n=1 Tax=Desulforamulus putei DSM 12395 TaxID=1121429 RepID=A0A1M4TWM2_9FIRM|nr:TIGR02680 family protein [Desulforamulus putei]SHE48840.1 TIGR02680 family protein [Desulforamulus putei DSM 12395]